MITIAVYYRSTRRLKFALTTDVDASLCTYWSLTDYCSDAYIWTIVAGMTFNQPLYLKGK